MLFIANRQKFSPKHSKKKTTSVSSKHCSLNLNYIYCCVLEYYLMLWYESLANSTSETNVTWNADNETCTAFGNGIHCKGF